MKVKISYTVELDEVPNQVSKHLSDKFPLSLDEVYKGIIDLIREGNIHGALEDIDLFRRDLAKLDLKLDDAQSILDGYMRARYSSNAETEQDVSKE